VADWFERGGCRQVLAADFGRLGLLGVPRPVAAPAPRPSPADGVLELEAGDSGVRSLVSVQGRSRCTRSGGSARPTEERWLPAMATGG
jgi:hypothetical protein